MSMVHYAIDEVPEEWQSTARVKGLSPPER